MEEGAYITAMGLIRANAAMDTVEPTAASLMKLMLG